MRTLLVVVLAVLLAEHFRLQHAGEGFPVQELIAEPAVEAFAVSVLPRAARLNVKRLEPAPCDPLLHRPGHELRVVVAADELGRATITALVPRRRCVAPLLRAQT